MKNSSNTVTYGGPGFCTLLGLLFIALKLTGYIQWSWLWVLAPFWIPLVLIALILTILGVVVMFKKK